MPQIVPYISLAPHEEQLLRASVGDDAVRLLSARLDNIARYISDMDSRLGDARGIIGPDGWSLDVSLDQTSRLQEMIDDELDKLPGAYATAGVEFIGGFTDDFDTDSFLGTTYSKSMTSPSISADGELTLTGTTTGDYSSVYCGRVGGAYLDYDRDWTLEIAITSLPMTSDLGTYAGVLAAAPMEDDIDISSTGKVSLTLMRYGTGYRVYARAATTQDTDLASSYEPTRATPIWLKIVYTAGDTSASVKFYYRQGNTGSYTEVPNSESTITYSSWSSWIHIDAGPIAGDTASGASVTAKFEKMIVDYVPGAVGSREAFIPTSTFLDYRKNYLYVREVGEYTYRGWAPWELPNTMVVYAYGSFWRYNSTDEAWERHTIAHYDTTGQTEDDHHNRLHDIDGSSDHTALGLTANAIVLLDSDGDYPVADSTFTFPLDLTEAAQTTLDGGTTGNLVQIASDDSLEDSGYGLPLDLSSASEVLLSGATTGNFISATAADALQDSGYSASSFATAAHLHDGQTLEHDGVNSDGGAFSFNTTGAVTHNQNLQVTKVDPEIRLTDSGDSEYARMLYSDTDQLRLYSRVERPGSSGYALEFDPGSSEYGLIGSSGVSLANEFTISTWFYLDTAGAYRMMYATSVIADATKFGCDNTAGTPNFFVRVVPGGSSDTSIATPGTGQWVHVVLRRDSSDKVDLFVNGGSANRLFSDAAQSGTFLMRYLARDTGGNYWDGKMDELRVWDTDLSDANCQALYGSGNGYYPNDIGTPVWGSHFDDGSGTTLTDFVSGDNCTLYNTPSWVTGKVSAPSTQVEANVIHAYDGSATLEEGIILFGDPDGRHVIEGKTIRGNIGGTERFQIDASGDWDFGIDANHAVTGISTLLMTDDLTIDADSKGVIFGDGQDSWIYDDGSHLNIDVDKQSAGSRTLGLLNGYVGINFSTPETYLHILVSQGGGASSINPAASDAIAIEASDGGYVNFVNDTMGSMQGILFSDTSRAVGRVVYDHSNDRLELWAGSTQVVDITSTGADLNSHAVSGVTTLSMDNQLTSTLADGTKPFVITSTTLCDNLNADLLDGQEGSYYLDSANFSGTDWTDLTDGGETTLHDHAASGITSGTLVHERGGLEADVSAYNGLVKISGGSTSAVTDNSANWDTAYGWGDHAGLYAPKARTLFIPVTARFSSGPTFSYPYGWYEDAFAISSIDSSSGAFFNFQVPDDFSSLTEAKVVIIPDATETIQWDVNADWGAAGESHTANSDSESNVTQAVTNDEIEELDVSGALDGIAAGDYVGMRFLSDTDSLHVLGLRLKYS